MPTIDAHGNLHDNLGQFANTPQATAGFDLAPAAGSRLPREVPLPTASVVEVPDRAGVRHRVTPGVLDENADHVFGKGQCFALAVAMRRQRGYTLVGFVHGDRAWANGDGEMVADDIVHMAARDDATGVLYDIKGAVPDDVLADFDGDDDYDLLVADVSDDDVANLFTDPRVAPQHIDLAGTFVDEVCAPGFESRFTFFDF